MSIFDTKRTRRRGCPVCGEPNTLIVTVYARKLVGGRASGQQVSRSFNFCAEHGEPVFVSLVEQLEAARSLT